MRLVKAEPANMPEKREEWLLAQLPVKERAEKEKGKKEKKKKPREGEKGRHSVAKYSCAFLRWNAEVPFLFGRSIFFKEANLFRALG